MQRCPPEIHAEIFLQYLASNPLNPWLPLILSAVDTSWRQVALHLARLWANVPLCGDEVGYHLMDEQDPFYRMVVEGSPWRAVRKGSLWRGLTRAEDLKEWLKRSAESPLTVSYTHPVRWGLYSDSLQWKKIPSTDFFQAFHSVRGRVTQLKLVDLRVVETDKSMAAKTFALSEFPKLQRLVVHPSCKIFEYFNETGPMPFIRYLEVNVATRDMYRDPLMADVTKKLPGLVSCRLKPTSTTNSDLATFCNIPALEEVTINLSFLTNYDSIPNTPSDSHIKRLYIQKEMAKDQTTLEELHFPRLQVLSWSHAHGMRPSGIRVQLKRLLQTSSPALDTLIFDAIRIKDKALIESLEVLPTLRYLKLHTTAVTDTAIEALADSGRGLCPELLSLEVKVKKTPYHWQRISQTALKSLKEVRDRLEVFYNGELL